MRVAYGKTFAGRQRLDTLVDSGRHVGRAVDRMLAELVQLAVDEFEVIRQGRLRAGRRSTPEP